ncbi:hypothetical protein LTR37_002552 [Vermiconidia calcicola]|uniref:Uncharacterized protein n=1 Tax=Vermiconidia calcicola TaxID=1690605 RepID=A0ACC3NS12_9PEZI|nr:hypothetical protein LTR37_002552 [Vermiconidia calcicola]
MQLLPLVGFISLAAAQSTSEAQDTTAFALSYGYPLLAWQSAYAPVVGEIGANIWNHARELRSAEDRTVVKPNVDTLYSTLVYDLSQSDVEITIPDVPEDSFKLFSFYDPFGDNFANIGTGGFFEPGSYLVRPYDRPGGSSNVGLQIVSLGGSSTGYIGSINSPTLYGILLVRWGVNATNADTVHGWQDQCEVNVLAPAGSTMNTTAPPRLESLISVYDEENRPAENVLNLLARFAPSNAPSELEAAGISDGDYMPVSSVDLPQANSTALAMAMQAAADPDNLVTLNNGWSVLSPELIGVYGTNYALRTIIAISGYLALRNPYAVYPTYSNDSEADANAFLTIGADEAVFITFSGKPPLQEAGFWSLTAYGDDYFLIPNDEDVYALGDRSNITYANGQRVYGFNNDDRDGVFQILIQPADVAPPANWTNNWLPAPSGGGEVIAQLRFFAGEDPLINGDYVYPVLEKMAALGSSASSSGNGTSSSDSTPTSSPDSSPTSGSGSSSGPSSGSSASPTSGSTGESASSSLVGSALLAFLVCLTATIFIFP